MIRMPGFLRATASLFAFTAGLYAQHPVWNPDNGDGTYQNPILFADYSDPDVIRVGKDFYLVASSFDAVPGLPILHSTDLVHWEIVAHALTTQPPTDVFDKTQHGNGVWAPSLRFHDGHFFLFYPDPDLGIYMLRADSITGPWTQPLLIKAAKGWIDPCPLWDDDGNAYLINGLAASRSGVKTALILSRMAPDGTRLLDEGTLILDGHPLDPTLEGPKIYKRHGFYYVSAPAGGVPTGWQVVFRAKNIYGPYERRIVLAQGNTAINGPHQGAWVDTPKGESWFLHFQDQGPYGRDVLLEPMHWSADGWPVIGIDQNAAGTGQPVARYRKPAIDGPTPTYTPAESDEFNGTTLGPQWQWQANPQPGWAFPMPNAGALRLIARPTLPADGNLWNTPNLLLQKFPAPAFTATTKVTFTPRNPGDRTGLVVMGKTWSALELESTTSGVTLSQITRQHADQPGPRTSSSVIPVTGNSFYLRAAIEKGAMVHFSYSLDGEHFTPVGTPFQATVGIWIGAKIGLFATNTAARGEFGYADYDWFRIEP